MRIRNRRTGKWIELPDDDGMVRVIRQNRHTKEIYNYAREVNLSEWECSRLANELWKDNPKFNPGKFMKACQKGDAAKAAA